MVCVLRAGLIKEKMPAGWRESFHLSYVYALSRGRYGFGWLRDGSVLRGIMSIKCIGGAIESDARGIGRGLAGFSIGCGTRAGGTRLRLELLDWTNSAVGLTWRFEGWLLGPVWRWCRNGSECLLWICTMLLLSAMLPLGRTCEFRDEIIGGKLLWGFWGSCKSLFGMSSYPPTLPCVNFLLQVQQDFLIKSQQRQDQCLSI